jgi:menaquinone-specific isochorismate synthase
MLVSGLAVSRSAEDLVAITTPLAVPVDLLAWLPAPRHTLSWVRDGDGLVGWGVAATFSARGPGRFARALRWWQDLTARAFIGDEVGEPGTGLVAFAGMAFAVQSLAETLAPFCTHLHVPDEPTVLHLRNISHLATDVHGTLAADTPLLDLVAQVHPTAAGAGSPRQNAMRVIGELEAMDRGGYLGPVGWLDAQGNGEFGVALRCAQLQETTARLFAGGGIVADSEPDTEAAEVAAEFRVFQSALSMPG